MADGQVTMGGTVVKPNVKKTRRIGEQAVGGFAGATADAFTLFERLETKLEEHPGKPCCGGADDFWRRGDLDLPSPLRCPVQLLHDTWQLFCRSIDACCRGVGENVAHG